MYMFHPNRIRIRAIGSIGARGMKGVLRPRMTPATRVGCSSGNRLHDEAAPAVAAEDRLLDAEVIQQAHEVARQVLDASVGDRRRS